MSDELMSIICVCIYFVGLIPAAIVGAYVEGRGNDETSLGLGIGALVFLWPMLVFTALFALVTFPIWKPVEMLTSRAHRAGRRHANKSEKSSP